MNNGIRTNSVGDSSHHFGVATTTLSSASKHPYTLCAAVVNPSK